MRKRTISVALGLVVSACWLTTVQSPAQGKKEPETNVRDAAQKALKEWIGQKPKDGSLEELLARALKNNADIFVAQAKLAEAEAELNRVRQLVMKNVIAAHGQIVQQRIMVDEAVAKLERVERLAAKKSLSTEEVGVAALAVKKVKAELATMEALLPYLTARQPSGQGLGTVQEYHNLFERIADPASGAKGSGAAPKTQKIKEETAEKLRTALDILVKCNFDEISVADLLAYLAEKGKDINIGVLARDMANPEEVRIRMRLATQVPLGAALQWLEDHLELRCIVRDYGLVLVPRDNVPPGALLLQDFWKAPTSKHEKK